MKPYRISLDQLKKISFLKMCFLAVTLFSLLLGYIHTRNGPLIPENGQLVYVLLDVSQSMLVQDSPKQSSRLDFAKQVIQISVLNTQIFSRGASIFAGQTQTVSPITHDTTTFLTLLQGVDHNNIQKQGSDILQALQETAHHFGSGNKKKILLLLSDGSDSNLQLPTELINQYKNLDIKVVVCGFGTVQGGPIVLGKDVFGHQQYRLYQGKPVIASLNQTTLQSLALQLGGDYIHLQSIDDIHKLTSHLEGGKYTPNIRRALAFLSFIGYLLSEYISLGRKK